MIEAAILTAIAARLDAALTGQRRPPHAIVVGGARIGWVDPARAARLAAFREVFVRERDDLVLAPRLDTPEARTAALQQVAMTLAAEGALTAWRDERYAVRTAFAAPALLYVERAAARYFGIRTYAAHGNGLVAGNAAQRDGVLSTRMWLARRSPTKAIDPSLLDNLVGGGIARDESPAATLRREAFEEAGIEGVDIDAPLATLTVERAVADGYQRETIFAYDLWLPPTFVPCNQDGEVVEHRCVGFAEAARLMANARGPDVLTLDATLVALDCLRRHGADADPRGVRT